ncbi:MULTISPECIES: hypothetical protein [Bacteria]|jgi:hypothetical protein
MTALIILLLVGGGALATTAWAIWQDPVTRQSLRRRFSASERR